MGKQRKHFGVEPHKEGHSSRLSFGKTFMSYNCHNKHQTSPLNSVRHVGQGYLYEPMEFNSADLTSVPELHYYATMIIKQLTGNMMLPGRQ